MEKDYEISVIKSAELMDENDMDQIVGGRGCIIHCNNCQKNNAPADSTKAQRKKE